jgi:hypothetical protein
MLIYALLQTIELWIFLSILGVALLMEAGYNKMKARNEAHQLRIDAEIDRLHK